MLRPQEKLSQSLRGMSFQCQFFGLEFPGETSRQDGISKQFFRSQTPEFLLWLHEGKHVYGIRQENRA